MKAPCGITCFLAVVIIVSKLIMTVMVANDSYMAKYEQHFTPELQALYKQIAKERLQIYTRGYIIGLILSIFLIIYTTQVLKQPMSGVSMVCMAVTVSFFVSYFHYTLTPKSNWMLHHIKGEKEVKAWLVAYRTMQNHYHSAFIMGLVGVGVLAFAFRGTCK
jgi:uncharacterized protein YacL